MMSLRASATAMVALIALTASPVHGVLGETKSEAEEREANWKARYGAVAPILSTGPDGLVAQECWSAPSTGWTDLQAVKFAKELLPEKSRPTLRVMERQPNRILLETEDGHSVTLVKSEIGVIDVSVRAKDYDGPGC